MSHRQKEKKARREKQSEVAQKYDERRMRKIQRIIIVSLIVILLVSGTLYFILTHKSEEKEKSWTMVLYMSGDNSLSDYVNLTLDRVSGESGTGSVNVLVMCDKRGNGNTELLELKGSKFIKINISLIDEEWGSELNLADYKVLETFLRWALDYGQAKHTFLSIWSHGDNYRSFVSDGSSYMHLNQFDMAMTNLNKKIDVIGFDTCAMASVEIFYELRDYADFAIASEKKEPNEGWPYDLILKDMKSGKTPYALVKSVPAYYVSAYKSKEMNPQSFSLELSAVQLSNVDSFMKSFDAFMNYLQGLSKEEIMDGRNSALGFEDKDFIDVGNLSIKLGYHDLNLGSILVSTGVWKNPTGIEVAGSSGAVIYFPADGNNIPSEYRNMRFCKDTGWDEKLDSFY